MLKKVDKIYNHISAGTRIHDDVIIWIPKNASSTIRTLGNKIHYPIDDFIPRKNIIFLRNPYLRWKSGVVEYMFRNRNKIRYVLENIDKIEFDEHTVPQTRFFNVNADNNVYYNLDFWGMKRFATEYKFWQNTPIPNENQTITTHKKHKFMEKLDCVITKELQDKIKEHYFEDYKIIEQQYWNSKI